jgi:hypothetical protein
MMPEQTDGNASARTLGKVQLVVQLVLAGAMRDPVRAITLGLAVAATAFLTFGGHWSLVDLGEREVNLELPALESSFNAEVVEVLLERPEDEGGDDARRLGTSSSGAYGPGAKPPQPLVIAPGHPDLEAWVSAWAAHGLEAGEVPGNRVEVAVTRLWLVHSRSSCEASLTATVRLPDGVVPIEVASRCQFGRTSGRSFANAPMGELAVEASAVLRAHFEGHGD